MIYFAYGSNLNARAVADWCRHMSQRVAVLRNPRPAVLDNYRLCFPVFSEYWKGGTGDIEYDAGKYVMGATFEVTPADISTLDLKVGRKLDNLGHEIGIYKQVEVTVTPLGKGAPTSAVTYQGTSVEKNHIPPTSYYMDLVIQGAYAVGLSLMWISYLQSFSLQDGKPPGPPRP